MLLCIEKNTETKMPQRKYATMTTEISFCMKEKQIKLKLNTKLKLIQS